MKKWYTIVLLTIALCLFAVPVWAESYDDEAYDDEEFEYEGDPPLAPEIRLISNPSTGYRWFFTCDEPEVVEVMEHGFIGGQEGLLGAPGMECFRLNGCEMGISIVTFTYARSAEETPLYTITYQVQVDEDWNAMIYQTSFEMN